MGEQRLYKGVEGRCRRVREYMRDKDYTRE